MAEENEIEELEDTVTAGEADGEENTTEENEGSEDTTESGEDTVPSAQEAAGEAHQSRAAARIAKLSKQARDAEERAIRAETLAEERNRAPAQPANNAEAARQREEKLALMDPTERKMFLQDETLQNMQQQILITQVKTADSLDKSAYATQAASNPIYAKHSAEVEKRLRSEWSQGRTWPRETILAQIIGENALKAKPNTKAKDEAKERVTTSKGPLPRARGESTYRPGRAGESLEEMERRLENVTF